MDITKLEEGLQQLTGYDFENTEKACRIAGTILPEISFSKDFQARLAAKALDVKLEEIKKLPISEYIDVTMRVSNFLFGNLADLARQDK